MSKPTVKSLTADLIAEHSALDAVVSVLDFGRWQLPTPSPHWAVRDQIAHLAFFDEKAALAIADPDGFVADRSEVMRRMSASAHAAHRVQFEHTVSMRPDELVAHWRDRRRLLVSAATGLGDTERVEWYGPSMGARSFLTARLMETWAHGQDICDAVAAVREPTDRLRHIAQLGYVTRAWSYRNRGLAVPAGEVRVELASPSGAMWTWGPADADDRIRGSAMDFCLVTSQRRNVADTKLLVEGPLAVDWMNKAQLFAGPPSDPRPRNWPS